MALRISRVADTLRASIAVVGLAGIAWPISSQAIDIEARVSAATIYTDNVTLAPKGEEDGDFAFRLDPSVNIVSTGTRYDFRLDYLLEAYYFTDQDDSTSVFHQGEAKLDLELLPEHLVLKSLATIDQVVKDPSGPIFFGNLPITGNRTEATRLEIMPEWRQDIFGSELVAGYRLGRFDYDDGDLQDMEYQIVDARLTSPDVERGLGWGARYEYQVNSYDLPPDLKRQFAEASLSWSLGGGWTPFGAFGRESDVTDRTDASMTENLWRLGLRRRSASSFVEVFGGDRSFGSWYGALVELIDRSDSRNRIRLSYDETPVVDDGFDQIRTFRDLAGLEPPTDPGIPGIVDPTLPPGTVGPGSRQIYTRKAARLLISRTINRSDVSFVVFHENDEDIISFDQPDVSRDNEETGAAINVVYRLGSRTHVTGDVMYSQREFDTSGSDSNDDSLFYVRVGAKYELGQRTDVNFWVGHEEQSGSASSNYKENQVGISLGRTF